ncbi:MAG: PAS-domain containing protein [Alphaproteobacteria bacterium]|nr:PAS-domain containing protein [Alphaproteobacteria bacterium]
MAFATEAWTNLLLAAIAGVALGFAAARWQARRGGDTAVLDALQSARDGFALWDAELRLLAWNGAFVEFLPHARTIIRRGMAARELVEASARTVFAPEDEARRVAWVEKRMRGLARGGEQRRVRTREGCYLEITDCRTQGGNLLTLVHDLTEVAEANRRVAEVEVRFRDGIEVIDDGFTLWDADDRLVVWNARYVEMYPDLAPVLRPGARYADCVRVVIERIYAGADEAERERLIATRMAMHRDNVSPREYTRPDGMRVQVLERRTADGGTVSIYRDVTAERRAVEELARSEAQRRDGIESMADGFVLWGPDRRLRTWNERLIEIMPHLVPVMSVGMTQDDFIGRACDAAYPDWSEAARAAWTRDRRAVAWMPAHRTTLSLADDRYVTISQRRTADGGLVATYHDVTAEVRATRRLAASEAESRRLAMAATNVQSGVVILDSESRIRWVNPAMARIVGVPVEHMLGKTPRAAYMSDRTPAESFSRIAKALNSGQRVRAEIMIRREGGGDIWVELDAAPIFSADGALESIVGLHTDIAERKRHQAELERALAAAREVNDQQRRFISIASHEFRTPLAVIDGAVQRIAAKLGEAAVDEYVSRRLQRIRAAIGRMTGMIELMLSSARLDEGKLRLETGAIDLTDLVREVCRRQRHISPQFTIATEGVEEGLRIEGDRRLLEQVFTNLLSNAVKYSGASRRIEVAAGMQSGTVEISVRDFGIGISPQDLTHMFTRFFRASTATGIPGTGIGLHFAKELVLLHGGTIDVTSEPGQGTTFRIRLPTAQTRAEDGTTKAA